MVSHTNSICKTCDLAHEGINGRYCNKLHRYVEYEPAPPCMRQQQPPQ